MTEIELESFHPRYPVLLVAASGASETWPAFVRGKDGVERVTMTEMNQVRVEFKDRPTLRLVASDGHGTEMVKLPAPIPEKYREKYRKGQQ